jgi:flagellar biosynthesis component FlhA
MLICCISYKAKTSRPSSVTVYDYLSWKEQEKNQTPLQKQKFKMSAEKEQEHQYHQQLHHNGKMHLSECLHQCYRKALQQLMRQSDNSTATEQLRSFEQKNKCINYKGAEPPTKSFEDDMHLIA